MQLDFYQIGQAGLEQVMLMLLKKTLAANQKGTYFVSNASGERD